MGNGNCICQVFHSTHYAGEDMVIKFGDNEPWKKVFGPIFIHLNSLPEGEDPLRLWQNAKEQVHNFCQDVNYIDEFNEQ